VHPSRHLEFFTAEERSLRLKTTSQKEREAVNAIRESFDVSILSVKSAMQIVEEVVKKSDSGIKLKKILR